MALQRPKRNKMNLGLPDNYLYFFHTGKKIVIPVDPDNINDSMSANFAQSTPLSRSAPIYSYQGSGPRTVQVSFQLHRDLCKEFNPGSEDAVDEMITNLNAAVLPDYEAASKIVNPPLVGLQIRDEIYIKGVVQGGVAISYGLPILNCGTKDIPKYKYALVNISFTIAEVTPYSASILPKVGGQFRGK